MQTTIEFGRDVDEAQGFWFRQAGDQSALGTWGCGNDQVCDRPALEGGLIVGIACDCGDVEWLRLRFRWGFERGIGSGCSCTEEGYDGCQQEDGGDHGDCSCGSSNGGCNCFQVCDFGFVRNVSRGTLTRIPLCTLALRRLFVTRNTNLGPRSTPDVVKSRYFLKESQKGSWTNDMQAGSYVIEQMVWSCGLWTPRLIRPDVATSVGSLVHLQRLRILPDLFPYY